MRRRTFLASLPALSPLAAKADGISDFFLARERQTGGRIGLYAHHTGTRRTLAWRAGDSFAMCSTFKMSLVAAVLFRVDRGAETLSRMVPYGVADLLSYAPVARQHLAQGSMSVETMCRAAIEVSDNTCANLLLASIGGPPILTRFWRETGDAVTRLDHTEPALNDSAPGAHQDVTTPAAMAGNLRRFVTGHHLSAASRALLTGWMLNCQTGTALLRAGLPAAWKIADKIGNNGHDAQSDIAVAWPAPDQPILIAAYTQGGSPQPSQLRTLMADIGTLIGQYLR